MSTGKSSRFVAACRCALILLFAMLVTVAAQAQAQSKVLRISRQFGLPSLGVEVVIGRKLIEKHAKALGLPNVQVSGIRLSGAAATNEALLSGSIDLAAAGIGAILQMWDKTNGNVKGILSLNHMAILLNTNDPRVKTLKDYIGITDNKIAVPAIKVSIQAIILEMTAKKVFGPGKQFALDKLMVSMPHPQAAAALISGRSGVRSHMGNVSISYLELKHKSIHTVFSSSDLFARPLSALLLYTTKEWVKKNPKLLKAVFGAFVEADDWINAHPTEAAVLFKNVTKSKLELSDLEAIIQNKNATDWSPAPIATLKIADFMYDTGQIKKRPANWKDYFWSIAYQMNGS